MTDFEPTIIAFVCNWCTYICLQLVYLYCSRPGRDLQVVLSPQRAIDPDDVHWDGRSQVCD
jgi:hypothetical protein